MARREDASPFTAARLRAAFPALVADMEAGDVEALAASLHEHRAAAGERLIRRGQRSDSLHLVAQGRLAVTIDSPRGSFDLGTCGPGGWVGELGLVDPGPASATVTATSACRLAVLDQAAFQRLRGAHPEAATGLQGALVREMVRRLRATSEQVSGSVVDGEEKKAGGAPRGGALGLLRRLFGLAEAS